MILTCPACATRFRVDDAQIPTGGRPVTCSRCGETWRAWPTPLAETPPAASAAPAETPAPKPNTSLAADRADHVTAAESPARPSSPGGSAWLIVLLGLAGLGLALVFSYQSEVSAFLAMIQTWFGAGN